jgi:hypothetical protein
MPKLRSIHSDLQLYISARVSISLATVGEILRRVRQCGVGYPLPAEISAAGLYVRPMVPITDQMTGEILQAAILVGCWAPLTSPIAKLKATLSQGLPNWIDSHVRYWLAVDLPDRIRNSCSNPTKTL